MKFLLCNALAVVLPVVWASAAWAHFNMLFPDSASVKRGDRVLFVYQWGHPYEHELFNAAAPQSVSVLSPDGKRTDLAKTLEHVAEPTTPTRYQFPFRPEQRGDFVFVLTTPAIWMKEDEEFLQDSVKVVLHVQAQKGWDTSAGQTFEMLPLTRPYGLQPGMAFQAQALLDGKPLAGALVEIERYNGTRPAELPPDEQITRTAKTGPGGVVTCTLTEPGWWCITAHREGGMKEHDGKAYPVRQRSTLWVFVDEKVAPKSK
jgi:cobalt/nickel transport protein